jgi:N6-adenosine-specific RNA methylase IME4
MMSEWPTKKYGAILADPPWRFHTWDKATAVIAKHRKSYGNAPASVHYQTLAVEDIAALPINNLAAENSVLFLWCCWPMLLDALTVITAWGFEYKTCAFAWTKACTNQIEMFRDDADTLMGMGYWTRANTEPCLLATRGNPKRMDAGIRQAIIEPRREHSRKPSCVYARIERLVAGPYLELFARTRRDGWDAWGNEIGKFSEAAE